MHMGNELLTLPVAGGLAVAAGAGVAFAAARARRDLDERRVPLLGVLGAFVFAAQMVNFPVLPGASGHFVGGALLAILLGPHAAALGMAAIVIVQCLVFQDGGLLALGANVLSMAVVGPYVAYGVFRALVAPGRSEPGPPSGAGAAPGRGRVYCASFLAGLSSVLAGALLVPLEVALAGVSPVPLHVFLGTMAGVHVVIGAAEGAITFAVLVALAGLRAELVPGLPAGGRVPLPAVALSIAGAGLLLAAFVSLAASGSPDGLEWTLDAAGAVADRAVPAAAAADAAASRIALLPGCSGPGGRWYWTSVSGVLGSLLVFGVVSAAARAVRRARRAPSAEPL